VPRRLVAGASSVLRGVGHVKTRERLAPRWTLQAPEIAGAEAWRILDRLRFDPQVRPDWKATP
jgi:hypothetical protein